MSRSNRKPGYYTCKGAHPDDGKRDANRTLRAQVRALTHRLLVDPEADSFVDDPRDKIRGSKGSRDSDWGWGYFGDGFRILWESPRRPHHNGAPSHWSYEEQVTWHTKISRK